jgi:endonuclease/exonuclease/phosphatase family metal-dependent hydrolase
MVVLTYNIWAGGGNRLDRIAEVIRLQDADAVAILEATEAAAHALAGELGMSVAFGEARVEAAHVAWLTRTPVATARNHRLPALAKTLLEIEVGELHLFATHLTSRHEVADYPRAGEIQAILATMRALGEAPHLLVGDFNALRAADEVGEPPPGVDRRGEAVPGQPRVVLEPLVAEGYVDCYRALHREKAGYTYTADRPWLRIDYAFASPSAAVRLCGCDVVSGAVAATASDHLPLRVELA